MKWEKKGLIYCPDGSISWQNSSAMLPTPYMKNENRLRIFFGSCDNSNVGRIGYIDVNPNNPGEIKNINKEPILNTGRKGAFDDIGIVPISLVTNGDEIYLYYIGFQLGVQVPYYMFCGLAISNDFGDSFVKYSQTSILDRCEDELYARCGVHVIKDDGKFKMWYVGSYKEGWVKGVDKMYPLYTMRYIESLDGINWLGSGKICMEFEDEDEHGFGRPYVWKESGLYKMLYSVRTYSRGYYLGYAESSDGITWDRRDNEIGIDISASGWDGINQSYPYLVNYKEKVYMLYNGNQCGKTGFGYAELVQQ